MQCMTISGRIALTASLALLFVTACGDDDDASPPSGSSVTATATLQPTAMPTPTDRPTASPLGADSSEVQQTLALPGFTQFAREFQQAVDDNDTQFFIDHAYFEDYSACSDVAKPIPQFGTCGGIETPPNGVAITVGLWESEGSYYEPQEYEDLTEALSGDRAPDAATFTIGRENRDPSHVVALFVESIGPFPGQSPVVDHALAFRVAEVDGNWRIVGVDRALKQFMPDHLSWYVSWDAAFP